MKLLYITNGIDGPGGLERVLSIKASILAEKYGYEVTILGLNEGNNEPFYEFSPRINFLSIPVSGNPLKYFTQYKKGLRSVVEKLQPDVISVCDDGLKGFFVPRLLKTKVKIIYERHFSELLKKDHTGLGFHHLKEMAKELLMKKLAKDFDKFIVLSPENKKKWRALLNIMVIPNPLSFFPKESSHRKNKKVISVGKISYQKGQDLLVKSWKLVHKQYPDWELALYGKENREFLKTDDLASLNIHYHPPERDIVSRYKESSIYVMSSRSEEFGMVLIEAMACGLPCVSFNGSYGPIDIISEGEDGFLVELGNVIAMAEKIVLLIKDETLRQKMGQTARENVKRFKADAIVGEWDKLFSNL